MGKEYQPKKLNQKPWAENIILGLAGEYDEKTARANVVNLATHSKKLLSKLNHTRLKDITSP